MSVKIITDSTSYIPEEYKKKYDIKVVSLNVIMNGKSFREVELDNIEFCEYMEAAGDIPTSSQPSLEEMYDAFEEEVKLGNDVIGIFISSKMSGAFSSANLVKNMILEKYPNAKIEIIDSMTNCMQMGYQVLQAARLAKEGKKLKEIIDISIETREHSKFLFFPDTLQYLKKGGRIGNASALIGTILQIKPILTVQDGVTTVFDKVRTKKRAINTIVEKVMKDIEEKQLGEVIVHHINCEKEGKALAKILEEKIHIPVKIQTIGPIIGLHVGPGSIGVAYYTKE